MGGKQNRNRGVRFERELARWLQARRVPMSGAGAVKGDVLVPVYDGAFLLLEAKSTKHTTYVVHPKMLAQVIKERLAMATFGVRAAMVSLRLSRYTEPVFLISEEDIHAIRQSFAVPFPVHIVTHGMVDATTVKVSPYNAALTFPARFIGSPRAELPEILLENYARVVWYYVPPTAFLTWLHETRAYYGYEPPTKQSVRKVPKRQTHPIEQLLEEWGYDNQA